MTCAPARSLLLTATACAPWRITAAPRRTRLCVFEYIYFARPDSVIDGTCVHGPPARRARFLALEHPVQADVVIGVPDSGLDAALGYSQESGIPYGIGFLKNKYIGRTFIQPNQKLRENTVRIKLNPIADTVQGKRVVMVDDSIVRGTTSPAPSCCARLVRPGTYRISAPPFAHPRRHRHSRRSLLFGHTVDRSTSWSHRRATIEHVRQLAIHSKCGFCRAHRPRRPDRDDGHCLSR